MLYRELAVLPIRERTLTAGFIDLQSVKQKIERTRKEAQQVSETLGIKVSEAQHSSKLGATELTASPRRQEL